MTYGMTENNNYSYCSQEKNTQISPKRNKSPKFPKKSLNYVCAKEKTKKIALCKGQIQNESYIVDTSCTH